MNTFKRIPPSFLYDVVAIAGVVLIGKGLGVVHPSLWWIWIGAVLFLYGLYASAKGCK